MAQEHFRAAYEINPRESRYRTALRARKAGQLTPLPVFGRAAVSKRKVVSSGMYDWLSFCGVIFWNYRNRLPR